MKNFFILNILLFTFSVSLGSVMCNCDVTVSQSGYYTASSLGILPGNTICIAAGTYTYLTFANIQGTPSQPITIKNCNGAVIINSSSSSSGISLTNSKYFRLSGNGEASLSYGIKVHGTATGAPAINASNLSTDFELDNIEVSGAEYAGIMIKTDPTCDPATWRENFTMRNVKVHHNYIHDVNGKGILVGYNAASVSRSCDGQTVTLYPANAIGLQIYQNQIERVGGEGILYANASDALVYNNLIRLAGRQSTSSGILLGSGVGGKLYNNQLLGSTGHGLSGIGYLGGNQIYNNVVSNAGLYGFYLDDRTETLSGSTVLLANNTIVGSQNAGIRFDNERSSNRMINNAIVGAKNGVALSIQSGVSVIDENNYKGAALASSFFVNPSGDDYHLLGGTALVNSGQSVLGYGITTDLGGSPRVVGNTTDLGAYEYQVVEQTPTNPCKVLITQNGNYNASQLGVSPGDKVCIQAGTYTRIAISNILGSSSSPVEVVNYGGQVIFNSSTNPSGLALNNCKYFKLAGSGEASLPYGIKISQTGPGASALSIANLSDEVEVERIEVSGAEYAGIMIKTDPTCDPATWRENFTMRNVKVHHNYIHDVNGKGILVGYNAASVSRSCDGQTVTLYPANAIGLQIYQNQIERVGGEGILYANASDALVYNNLIRLAGRQSTSSGILLGSGVGGKLYNNQLLGSTGHGLSGIGYLGGNQIYNNVVSNAGLYGFYLDDRTETLSGSTVLLANNTIVGSQNAGIRFDNERSSNRMINNAIVGAKNGVALSIQSGVSVIDENNYKGAALASSFFVNPSGDDYHLLGGTALVNSGQSVLGYGITTDLGGSPRVVGNTTDLGAYEYQVVEQTPTNPCKVLITQNGNYNASQLGVSPGDKVCIQAGTYTRIAISNILGSSSSPVEVVNYGGQVIFNSSTNPSGLALNNCKYFKLTGSGEASLPYGIKISQTGPGASALSIANLSDEVEVERIEVSGADFAGIMIKTDPTCDPATWRENFTMRNVKVHHNYIHDVNGEGLYIGHTFFSQGVTRTCDGQTITRYPHDIIGLEIYENLVDHTGAEGIQYACASDAEVHHNTVLDAGISPFALYQSNGIQIGGGAGGRLYNNIIKNTQADGIIVVGHLGNNKIFNNLVVDSNEYGIFCDDRTGSIPNTPVLIANNTIIRSRLDGIGLFNEINHTTIVNNVIMFPGSGFFIYANWGVPYTDQNNYKSSEYNNTTFIDIGGDYHLHPQSLLRDAGQNVSTYGITFDLDDNPRPFNGAYDIGAYEYGASGNSRLAATQTYKENLPVALTAYPSPCIDQLTVQIDDRDKIKSLRIYTAKGVNVIDLVPDTPTSRMNLSVGKFSGGTYLVQVTTSKGVTLASKFVKQ